ncbi:MAG: small ribosomal subunit Rsm22 family protein [Pseudolabrys sp.]
MELPPLLRRAVDNALNGTALSDLAATAAALSDRYREERHDIKPRVISDREALAYLAVRLPATYAAIRSSFNAVAEARPDFMPGNALDVGAGPGTALWAAVRKLSCRTSPGALRILPLTPSTANRAIWSLWPTS